MTNLFFTTGEGGGSYANNIIFDAESGALLFKPLRSISQERMMLAKYAYHVYQETGYLIEGLEIEERLHNGIPYDVAILDWGGDIAESTAASNTLEGDVLHSSKKTSFNKHKQIGLNSYINRDLSDNLELIVGGE